jgi:hypothetical protein
MRGLNDPENGIDETTEHTEITENPAKEPLLSIKARSPIGRERSGLTVQPEIGV